MVLLNFPSSLLFFPALLCKQVELVTKELYSVLPVGVHRVVLIRNFYSSDRFFLMKVFFFLIEILECGDLST